ncbi:MAG TPA: nucleotide sugar dehydrogenase, partial [Alphaproteobacteria bacterium]|nr:nucleotide sugar dehydrogenase [Alphaproteobacteria bacterium]
MQEKIAVIGLGYVGLPLLLGLSRHFDVTGFDIDARRVEALTGGHDWTGESTDAELKACKAKFTAKADDLNDCSFFIVTVPTPINQGKQPDLTPILGACKVLGGVLKARKKTDQLPLIVFESTVYPGLTEDICGPKISEHSGLKQHQDFKLGYSPERINPGDKKNRLETIIKIVGAEDAESLTRMEKIYGAVITAGLHKAPNIRVAETAKVLENTQRDLNIALMNELAVICDRFGIRTQDVLQAAGTKWNFLKFTPGLVGGHCIGVDPFYLTSRAEELGYHPEVILAGRRINDNMPIFIGQKVAKLLGKPDARIGILGLAFKENVRDLRNSRVPEIMRELQSFGAEVLIHDPLADAAHAKHEYDVALSQKIDFKNLDA